MFHLSRRDMTPGSRRVSLRGLRTFCVAARHESFRAAADELFITASAVSHQIKNLEQELGQRLFERKNRLTTLSDNGRSLFSEVDPLIERLDDITGRYRENRRQNALRLTIPHLFASELFLPRLHELMLQHPMIDIQVDTIDEYSDTSVQNADISIRLLRSRPEGITAEPLFPLSLVPAGSPAFHRNLRIVDGRITSEFPNIIHRARPRAWREWREWQDDSGITLPDGSRSIRLDSMSALARAAERGVGAALVPMPLTRLWFESGSLVRLFEAELATKDTYYVISRRDVDRQKDIRLIRDWLLQNFAERR